MIEGFQPRLMIRADRNSKSIDVTFDPRLAFTDQAVPIVHRAIDRRGTPLTERNLAAMASEAASVIYDLYSRGMVDAEPNLHTVTCPKFDHDCEQCVFLGHSSGIDLYFCPQSGASTLIARYGPGSKYVSGAPFVMVNDDLWKAAVLAEERGLGRWLEHHHTISIR